MSLLLSNLPPLRTKSKTYTDTFKNLLKDADSVNLATGYISTDSAIDLRNIIEANGGPSLNLCVGMHYFEGLSPVQYDALKSLDKSLREHKLGQVFMVTTFPFHGKIVSFLNDKKIIGSIIGSSNLSNIIEGQRQYEADYLIENTADENELGTLINDLISKSSKPLSELDVKIKIPDNDLLVDQIGVTRLKREEVEDARQNLSELSFDLPLKGDGSPRSGLNTSFGEGRRNAQGFVMPRPWYEVEIIVAKEITDRPGYPQADAQGEGGSFCVITDDGWTFQCKVSGQNSKNLRSDDDLKVLGKWLKGRLENLGLLTPGEPVTDKILSEYGRTNLTITKLANQDKWYIDFGVK